MGAMQEGACRRCLGGGFTDYFGTTILCPTCVGSGARRPEIGAVVRDEDGTILGALDARMNDDDTLDFYVIPARARSGSLRVVPPMQWEVDMARREDAQRNEGED